MNNTLVPNFTGYEEDFIKDLRKQVECEIASRSYKNLSNLKHGFGEKDDYDQINLISLLDILDTLLEGCNDCLKNSQIEDIVAQVKKEISK